MQEMTIEHNNEAPIAVFDSGVGGISVLRALLKEMPNEKIYIELTGNGFLYNMVRIIAGTLVDVGLGKIEPKEIENIIKSKKRENAGKIKDFRV